MPDNSTVKVLFIGDIVGKAGRRGLFQELKNLKSEFTPDITIANCENAAGGFGITQEITHDLLNAGIDVLTSGNHIWDKKEVLNFINNEERLLRPANYPPDVPGKGFCLLHSKNGAKITIINLIGRVFMENLDCPFRKAVSILEEIKKNTGIIIIDFHGEATSEKMAFAWYMDGRASLIVGTHTHIQTADERILKGGTGYITDVGMTGSINSVIGMKKEEAIFRFLKGIPMKFEVATEAIEINGIYAEINSSSGKTVRIERIKKLL